MNQELTKNPTNASFEACVLTSCNLLVKDVRGVGLNMELLDAEEGE